uniref:Uncharacterized protein n=1 Tax=Anopheles farauti TaxID=69004 RepID=A0A182Q1H2_9DIPT
MRPGPGLVVMALAFISGARRGTGQQSSSASQSGKLGKVGEDNTGGAGGGGVGGGALTRINPWLSACDLEQPNSAPDLQRSLGHSAAQQEGKIGTTTTIKAISAEGFLSALHNAAYADVLTGGYERCTGRLAELVETDALAARITCEFTEVLIRYDCGQPYSLIHHCEDCKDNQQNATAHASVFW